MILDNVADSASLFVETSPALHAEAFGHRDLQRFDVASVPDWFEKGVGEAKIQQILDRLLSKKMIDTKNPRLVKLLQQCLIECDG